MAGAEVSSGLQWIFGDKREELFSSQDITAIPDY